MRYPRHPRAQGRIDMHALAVKIHQPGPFPMQVPGGG